MTQKSNSRSQSTIFAMTHFDGKCQNLQKSPTYFRASSTVSQIKCFNAWPSKKVGQCHGQCHGTAPVYIAEMYIRRSFNSEHYQLRSAVRGELVVPQRKKVTLGRRNFRYAGQSLWNALPQDTRDASLSLSQFQSELKMFLHREVYHLGRQKHLRDGFVIRRRYISSATN